MASAIAYRNMLMSATVQASSQNLLYPASNVLRSDVQKRWRSVNSPAYLIIDLGAALSIDTIGLFGLTLSSTGTARIRVSTVDSTGVAGDAYDSGAVAVDPLYASQIGLITPTASARYVRLDFADDAVGYVECGTIFISVRVAYKYNFNYGWQRGWIDRSIRTKTKGGQTQIFRDNFYRTLNITFAAISETERRTITDMIDRLNGHRSELLVMLNTASDNLPRDSILGLATPLTLISQSEFGIFQKTYQIEERL